MKSEALLREDTQMRKYVKKKEELTKMKKVHVEMGQGTSLSFILDGKQLTVQNNPYMVSTSGNGLSRHGHFLNSEMARADQHKATLADRKEAEWSLL